MFRSVTILILFAAAIAAAKDPPKINGSYMAQAELVQALVHYGNQIMQIYFEENYDVKENKSSCVIHENGEELTLIEDFNNNQTFQYYQNECTMYTFDDWIASDMIDIRPYETKQSILFPLKQLMKLDKSNLRESKSVETTYRNISATLWKHRLEYDVQNTHVTVDVDAYWTKSWSSIEGSELLPLAFTLNITENNTVNKTIISHNQTVNILNFIPNTVDKATFKIPQGMTCIGMKSTLPFPRNLQAITVFSFNSEFNFQGYQTFMTVDAWWDLKNRLLRLDHDLMVSTSILGPTSLSMVISYKQGAVYSISKVTDTCDVTRLEDLPSIQSTFIEPNNNAMWNISNFFGLEGTSMIYIGDTEKRGIPCSVWQGERLDWPGFARPMPTLWEWCIANAKGENITFETDEIPVVNLEITIIETRKPDYLPKGAKLIYNFYNMKQHTPALLDTIAFDISPCFKGNMIKLKFYVQFDKSLKEALQNVTNDANFISLWKSEINHKIGLNFTSLRIAHLRMVIEGNKMLVRFALLGVHEKLRKMSSTEITIPVAKSALESAINKEKLTVEWLAAGKKTTLKAIPNSLTEDFITNTTDNTDTTTEIPGPSPSVKSGITTGSTPDGVTKSTTEPTGSVTGSTKDNTVEEGSTTENPQSPKQDKGIRHSPGIMALVSILMLFTGSGIGAAGTYFKFKGLPCKK